MQQFVLDQIFNAKSEKLFSLRKHQSQIGVSAHRSFREVLNVLGRTKDEARVLHVGRPFDFDQHISVDNDTCVSKLTVLQQNFKDDRTFKLPS